MRQFARCFSSPSMSALSRRPRGVSISGLYPAEPQVYQGTNDGMASSRTPCPPRRTWVLRARQFIWATALCGLIVGCAGGPTQNQTVSQRAVTVPAPLPSVHRPHLTVAYCADGTWSVPTALFTDANRLVADSIDQATKLDQDGLVAYVTYVAANPYLSQNTPLVITVPPLPAPPAPPTILPTPTVDPNNVFGHTPAVQTVTTSNGQAVQAYEQQLATLNAQLAHTQAQVKQQTDQLRALSRPQDANQTSLWSCIELAAQRFQQTSGSKELVIESDFEDNVPGDALASIGLDGVPVVAIFVNCHSGADCQLKRDIWGTAFQRMRAASFHLYESGQSQTLPPLFASTTTGQS